MARIERVDTSARQRLKQQGRGFQERQQYRDALLALGRGDMIEIEPEEGETLRKIKLNVSRASKEIGRPIKYGDTQENTVLVWVEDGAAPRRRGRPRKTPVAPSV